MLYEQPYSFITHGIADVKGKTTCRPNTPSVRCCFAQLPAPLQQPSRHRLGLNSTTQGCSAYDEQESK